MDISGSQQFYDDFFSEGRQITYDNKERYATIFDLIDEVSNENGIRVLDIGSGSGRISSFLNERFSEVIALDITTPELMVESISGTDIDFVKGALPYLPFKEKFDLVICSEVLEHIPRREEQRDAIAEISKVVTDNGHVVISTPNPSGLFSVTYDAFSEFGQKIGLIEGRSSPSDQEVENWIQPGELQSYLREHFHILGQRGSYYNIPWGFQGGEKILRPLSDFIGRKNLAPNYGLYQYYILEAEG